MARWCFQISFIFAPICGRFPFWPIFFKGVETTNQMEFFLCKITDTLPRNLALQGSRLKVHWLKLLLFQRWKHREKVSLLDVPTKNQGKETQPWNFFNFQFCRRCIYSGFWVSEQPTFWGFHVFSGGRVFPRILAQLKPNRVFPMMEPAKSTLEEVYEVTWKPSEKERSFVPHLSGEGF